MNTKLLHSLISCETDISGAQRRFSGNEELYLTCLESFLSDPTMVDLEEALSQEAWDDAFTAAHALKGLAGNMGFVPLFHACGELVIMIRTGKTAELAEGTKQVRQCYDNIVTVIREYAEAEA